LEELQKIDMLRKTVEWSTGIVETMESHEIKILRFPVLEKA